MVADHPRWPDHLQGEVLREVWRQELPPSYSGPILAHDAVFTTFTREGESEGVAAFDLHTGAARWKTEWPGTMQVAEFGASMGSWIRATPALDGSQLFVAGMPDLLVSLDANSGQILWQVDFKQRYGTPVPELGFVSSPLVVDQHVVVQAADSLVSVHRETGLSLWRTLIRQDVGQGSYSSPNIATIHGKRQILVANIPSIAGVDPENGELLWQRELDSYDQGCILAPIPFGDGVFTSTRASQSGYYPLSHNNGLFTVRDGWKNKLVAYMSDPVIIDNHAYMHLKNGRMACIDLKTGTERWISNRTLGTYCSLVAQQDRILALSNEGELFLLAATPESFQLLDARQLTDDETWGFLAIAGNRLIVRSKHRLLVYSWGKD